MKRGDLVVVVDPYMGEKPGKYRSLLYEFISGGRCLGAAVGGEVLTLLSEKRGRNGNIKVLHPTVGVCFIHASDIVVVDETG
jgi:hypothetical protein